MPLFQEDSSITRRHDGTGLGLVVVKELIEAERGFVNFTSSVDCGSDFWFALPLGVAVDPSGAVKDCSEPAVTDAIGPATLPFTPPLRRPFDGQGRLVPVRIRDLGPPVTEEYIDLVCAASGPTTASNLSCATTNTPVLIIDDNKFSAEALAGVASTLGLSTVVCTDAVGAVETFRHNMEAYDREESSEHFQFVLSDLDMPVMSGTRVVRRLHEVRRSTKRSLRPIRFVAVTGAADRQTFKDALEAGFEVRIFRAATALYMTDTIATECVAQTSHHPRSQGTSTRAPAGTAG